MISLQQAWREHAATANHRSSATFTETGLLLGADTVLVAFGEGPLRETDAGFGLAPSAHDRLVCLLAVAGRGQVGEATLLQIGQSIADWRKGDKALAGIRIAFAKLPSVSGADDAYRLFLAEKALDAGLAPHELLSELGYATTLRPLLKYPGQPRNPVGDRTGGRFASGPAGDTASVPILPVFLDTRHEQEEPATLPDPMHLVPSLQPGLPDLDLPPAGAPLPLPFLAPKVEPDEKEKDGPSCPAEAADRPNGPNLAGEAWEHFVHGLVNPSNPTADGNAYYLPNLLYPPNPKGKGDVSFDDCKKTNEPSSIPGLHKGDMVEAKSWMFNKLLTKNWSTAPDKMAGQIYRQNIAVEIEGQGRKITYCFDGELAASKARERYGVEYRSSQFIDCHIPDVS